MPPPLVDPPQHPTCPTRDWHVTYVDDTCMALYHKDIEQPNMTLPPPQLPGNLSDIHIGPIRSSTVRDQLQHLLYEYQDVFATSKGDIGLIANHEFEIPLKPDAQLPHFKPYRLSKLEQKEMHKLVQAYLDAGIMRKSHSPIASPAFLTGKKALPGKPPEYRLLLDVRMLNKATKPDPYPMPNLDDLLSEFKGKSLFSSLDMCQGYAQLPIKESDKWKTAFVTSRGHYELNRMLFGFRNAPATFQRVMDELFRTTVGVQPYLDDIMLATSTEEEQLAKLSQVFAVCRKANIKLRPAKCKLFMHELLYLGVEINSVGLKPNQKYLAKFDSIRRPTNKKQLATFLGLVGYLGRFIPHLAKWSGPLNDLRKKDRTFVWTPDCEVSWNKLLSLIRNAPILAHPDPSKPYFVQCDASDTALGAVLLQKNLNDEFVPINFISKTLDASARNWHVSEKELFAIVWALEKFSNYLVGKRFTVLLITVTWKACLTSNADTKFVLSLTNSTVGFCASNTTIL